MEKLAIFDVDFTITKRETLLEFYLYMVKRKPYLLKHMPKSFFSAFLYLIKVHDARRAKESFISFINNIHEEEMNSLAKDFYRDRFSKIFYKDAIGMIKKLKSEGFMVFLISASPEFYLKELYNIKEVDLVIGTRFTLSGGKYNSSVIGENCKGEEKVRRLMESLKEKNIDVDFKNSYMFSDSLADTPLLSLVGNPYLINFKNNHDKFQRLRWK